MFKKIAKLIRSGFLGLVLLAALNGSMTILTLSNESETNVTYSRTRGNVLLMGGNDHSVAPVASWSS